MTSVHAQNIDVALSVLGIGLVGGAIWALVLCVRGERRRGRGVASQTFWLANFLMMLAWVVVPAAVLKTAMDPDTAASASERQRLIAGSIAAGMYSTAHVLVAAIVAGVTWGVAAWKTRKRAAA